MTPANAAEPQVAGILLGGAYRPKQLPGSVRAIYLTGTVNATFTTVETQDVPDTNKVGDPVVISYEDDFDKALQDLWRWFAHYD